jgi:hypothetical protein
MFDLAIAMMSLAHVEKDDGGFRGWMPENPH